MSKTSSKPKSGAIILSKPAAKTGEVITEDAQPLVPADTFSNAHRLALDFLEHGRRSILSIILLGAELNRIKKQLGYVHGGNRRSSSESPNLKWPDLVQAQTGLHYDTCQEGMKMAEAGKKFIAILSAEDVASTPFDQLPEARQKEVAKAIKASAGSDSMTTLAIAWGVRQPPGMKESNRHKGGNDTTKINTPEEDAQEQFVPIYNILKNNRIDDGDAFAQAVCLLPLDLTADQDPALNVCLVTLEDELGRWHQIVKEVRQTIAKHLHGSHEKDAAKRIGAAQAKAHTHIKALTQTGSAAPEA